MDKDLSALRIDRSKKRPQTGRTGTWLIVLVAFLLGAAASFALFHWFASDSSGRARAEGDTAPPQPAANEARPDGGTAEDSEEAGPVLGQMTARKAIGDLLLYQDDEAGGLMSPRVVARFMAGRARHQRVAVFGTRPRRTPATVRRGRTKRTRRPT